MCGSIQIQVSVAPVRRYQEVSPQGHALKMPRLGDRIYLPDEDIGACIL